MDRGVVSMVRYEGPDSVGRAIELCDGLEGVGRSTRVVIKPNLVGWDAQGPYPPWGTLTTSRVVEGLCAALKEKGVEDIRIGEASIRCKDIGSGTREIFQRLGYEKLVERYGVRLVDFNEGPFREVEIEPGHKLLVTKEMDTCDFLISVPVLKTHGGTIVSLGMKNLKGLLHSKSKHYCHHPDNLLDHFIARLAQTYPPGLTLIDGIYANEQGPLHMGFAHRWNLLIASRDVFAADLLGAYILGYGAEQVKYLAEVARDQGRSVEIRDLKIRGGIDPEEVRKPLKWDWPWLPDNSGPEPFGKLGLRGLRLPKYEHSLCTGCSYMFNPLMLLLMSTPQKEFDQYEILSGSVQEPSADAKKTFLFGQCQIRKNQKHPGAKELIPIKGCPPSMAEIEKTLNENGIPVSRKGYEQYRLYIMSRYWKKPDVYPLTDFYLGEIPASELPPAQKAPG